MPITAKGIHCIDNFLKSYFEIDIQDSLDEERKLLELERLCYEECEKHDLIVCSAINENGVAMPANAYEADKVNKHAHEAYKALVKEFEKMGVNYADWKNREYGSTRKYDLDVYL